jgi:FkbM family methyltransferase
MSVRLITKSVWSNPGNRGQRIMRICRAVEWQFHKRVLRTTRILRLPNGMNFKAYPDCVISSALIYSAWPEFWELRFIRQFLRPGEAVIDVGANIGHISLLLADIACPENIFAFEPTPVSFRRLQENWTLNGWSTNHLYQAAVGRATGRVQVPDSVRPETKNSISSAATASHCVEVPLVSLDSQRSRWQDRRLGLLKVDVEGYEPEVFAGAIEMLRQDRPRLVMFESLGGKVEPEVAQVFLGAGYKVFQLDDVGRPDFDRQDAQNLFALPQETTDSLVLN